MQALLDNFHRITQSGRLGRPVFLRCQISASPERALVALAEVLADACALFGDTPASLQARGDAEVGTVHALLLFHSGACVLAYSTPGDEAADVMLLGNHGAAYGTGTAASGSQRAITRSESEQHGAGEWEDLLRRSLSDHRPVEIDRLSHA